MEAQYKEFNTVIPTDVLKAVTHESFLIIASKAMGNDMNDYKKRFSTISRLQTPILDGSENELVSYTLGELEINVNENFSYYSDYINPSKLYKELVNQNVENTPVEEHQSELDTIINFFADLVSNSKPLDSDIAEIVDSKFMDLI